MKSDELLSFNDFILIFLAFNSMRLKIGDIAEKSFIVYLIFAN